jgi:uracil-DNA glycosylase family 4
MNDIQKEFLGIVEDVRAHLEYQRALGVKSIEVGAIDAQTPIVRPAVVSVAKEKSIIASATPSIAASKAGTTPSLSSSPLEKEDRRRGGGIAEQTMTLEAIREEIGDCTRCKLHTGRKNIVFGEGNPEAVIVFVGEGPGFEEDQQGRPFVGEAGQLLTDIIEKGMKINRAEVYICNIVKCRPPGNRNPEPDEVEACIGFVKKQIRSINPKVIVTLGNVPTQNLLGTKQGITKLRGTWQAYEGIPVMPTFHPAYLLRSPGEKGKVWSDIKLVLEKLGMPIPEKK